MIDTSKPQLASASWTWTDVFKVRASAQMRAVSNWWEAGRPLSGGARGQLPFVQVSAARPKKPLRKMR